MGCHWAGEHLQGIPMSSIVERAPPPVAGGVGWVAGDRGDDEHLEEFCYIP